MILSIPWVRWFNRMIGKGEPASKSTGHTHETSEESLFLRVASTEFRAESRLSQIVLDWCDCIVLTIASIPSEPRVEELDFHLIVAEFANVV